eukprot:g9940.t1
MTATTTTTTPRGAARNAAAPSAATAAAAAAAGVGSRRPALSAKPSRPSSSSFRPLLLPALISALLLVVLLGGGAGTPVAAAENVLTPNIENVKLPEKPKEKRSPEGLYFFLNAKTPRRCFVVTEGRGSKFHVHYDFPAAENGEKIELELRQLSEYSTPKDRFSANPIERKIIDTVEGSHQFTIKSKSKKDTFSLCAVTPKREAKGRGQKLYLDLDTGMQDKWYDGLRKELNLDDVQISMIQLKNTAQQMLRTADTSKELETGYHKTLLQLNREVLWWPVSQVVILVVMGFYQVRHLKKFFKSKRLV